GNDVLDASSSNAANVLVGGAGNDVLYGGQQPDVLIGGAGSDSLNAGRQATILIGASTDFDNNVPALGAVSSEWSRTDVGAQTRVGHLNGSQTGGLNGTYVLTGNTVH